MRKPCMFFIVFLFLSQANSYPQEQSKTSDIFNRSQVGIQINPYLNDELFHRLVMNTVYGMRYGYLFSKPVLIGAEINGYFPYFFNLENPVKYFNLNIGLFSRYSLFTENRIQGFIEISPYYSFFHRDAHMSFPEVKDKSLGLYFAPGLSFYTKNRKFSIDLYNKFSNLSFVNGKKSVLSYKVNYNF